jgi:hypothetical protein
MVRLVSLRVDSEIWNFTFKPTKCIKPLRSLSEKFCFNNMQEYNNQHITCTGLRFCRFAKHSVLYVLLALTLQNLYILPFIIFVLYNSQDENRLFS